VQEAVHPEANIIFGAVIDDTLGDEVRVTVIAAGFDGGEPGAKPSDARRSNFVSSDAQPAQASFGSAATTTETPAAAQPWNEPEPAPSAPADRSFDGDDDDGLDIPDFLK
jgi:cell division protein FtsZ